MKHLAMVLKRARSRLKLLYSFRELHNLTSARVECAQDEVDATFAKEKLALMTQESESRHHSKCILEIQALLLWAFAALKASDQTIMKDMLQGETHRMHLCPLGVILLVNNVVSTNESNIDRWSCRNLRV
ncbi:hypothetical protein SELMODRAFT_427738 [Selaginella moellendorffii]|uniref:Uncharacterized protein n=1 Tax=Selaginella moellendorffii TaxID=88036 RepID=D8T0K3_SELML|nr:hypothetical protein SELMODRAFT_427738 [Selaginella moellendorffii]